LEKIKMSIHDTKPTARAALVSDDQRRADVVDTVDKLVGMAIRTLPHMYCHSRDDFVQLVRRDETAENSLRKEGGSLRYTAIVGLGAAWLDQCSQQELLAGMTAHELVRRVVIRAKDTPDLGALSGWAAAEVRQDVPHALFNRLVREVEIAAPQPTVHYAWTLTALVAAYRLKDFSTAAHQAAERLMSAQEASGLFPHVLPRSALSLYRAHVGCFADQIYPIQALVRYFAVTGDRSALDAANRCATRIVTLQGPAGQWWWHYDISKGVITEGYPVYSVHQHAMGPMALFELHEAGGTDHLSAIVASLCWLNSHPEVDAELLDNATGLVWRKVYRREPRKFVRALRAAATALSSGLRLGLLDQLCPPRLIDYGCHSYELGWLLYAWKSHSIISSLLSSSSPSSFAGHG
jgi:hypothetical protein